MWRKTFVKLDPICDHVLTHFTSLCLTPSGGGPEKRTTPKMRRLNVSQTDWSSRRARLPGPFLGLNCAPFLPALLVQRHGLRSVRRYTFVLGLTRRSLIVSEGNLRRKHKNANCFLSEDGSQSLRTSACLNTGIVQMWAPSSGLLSLDLSKQSEDSKAVQTASTAHGHQPKAIQSH